MNFQSETCLSFIIMLTSGLRFLTYDWPLPMQLMSSASVRYRNNL
jgi:hypothetical protein